MQMCVACVFRLSQYIKWSEQPKARRAHNILQSASASLLGHLTCTTSAWYTRLLIHTNTHIHRHHRRKRGIQTNADFIIIIKHRPIFILDTIHAHGRTQTTTTAMCVGWKSSRQFFCMSSFIYRHNKQQKKLSPFVCA